MLWFFFLLLLGSSWLLWFTLRLLVINSRLFSGLWRSGFFGVIFSSSNWRVSLWLRFVIIDIWSSLWLSLFLSNWRVGLDLISSGFNWWILGNRRILSNRLLGRGIFGD